MPLGGHVRPLDLPVSSSSGRSSARGDAGRRGALAAGAPCSAGDGSAEAVATRPIHGVSNAALECAPKKRNASGRQLWSIYPDLRRQQFNLTVSVDGLVQSEAERKMVEVVEGDTEASAQKIERYAEGSVIGRQSRRGSRSQRVRNATGNDPLHALERRLLQVVAVHHFSKRGPALIVRTQVNVGKTECNRPFNGWRHVGPIDELEYCFGVDKSSDEPRSRDAIQMQMRSRDPAQSLRLQRRSCVEILSTACRALGAGSPSCRVPRLSSWSGGLFGRRVRLACAPPQAAR
jgi:hypothetical protein